MKKLLSISLMILILFDSAFSVSAAEQNVPYTNYTYSSGGSIIESPQAYLPESVIYGHNLGIGSFKNAVDIDCDENGDLYILDNGNNRAVVLDSNMKLKRVISLKTKLKDGTEISLKESRGITVTRDKIYICDTENHRVLVFNKKDGKYLKMYLAPSSKALDEDFLFKPIKVSIDNEENLYIVSEGTFEGIINLDSKGGFLGFFATNEATASSWELFWRRFSTVEQRKKSIQFVPQDFSSIDIDESGFFLITTSTEVDNSMIKRVNPGGNNVIRNVTDINLSGDVSCTLGENNGDSSFIDVTSGPFKIYACLDSTRGKVFCYNNDGNLLYTFGYLSEQKGGFTAPVAITYLDGQKIAVLDNRTSSITVFSPTVYAKTINSGVDYTNRLEYDKALVEWAKVFEFNQNFTLAQDMIAKSYYEDGDNSAAMKYFKSAGNKQMYSTVKETVRKNWLYKYTKYFIIGAAVLICLIFVMKTVKRIRNKAKNN